MSHLSSKERQAAVKVTLPRVGKLRHQETSVCPTPTRFHGQTELFRQVLTGEHLGPPRPRLDWLLLPFGRHPLKDTELMSNPPGGFGDAGVPLHASPHGQLRAQDRGGTLSVGAAGLTISEVFPASPVGSEEAGGGGAGVGDPAVGACGASLSPGPAPCPAGGAVGRSH